MAQLLYKIYFCAEIDVPPSGWWEKLPELDAVLREDDSFDDGLLPGIVDGGSPHNDPYATFYTNGNT